MARRAIALVSTVILVGAGISVVTAAAPASAAPGTVTFGQNDFGLSAGCAGSSGAPRHYDVPAEVSALTITVIGGRGGTGGDSTFHGGGVGGLGGKVTATIPVTENQRLYISSVPGASTFSASAGGLAPFVSLDDACGQNFTYPSQPLITAGGGGGGGAGDTYGPGGTGGNAQSGGNPGGNNQAGAGAGGGGGSATAGGTGGTSAQHGANSYVSGGQPGGSWQSGGLDGIGGEDSSPNPSGGGGGAGRFGGGGGGGSNGYGGGGGGGGGNFVVGGATNVTMDVSSDAPLISITPASFLYHTSTSLSARITTEPSDQGNTYTATVTAHAGAPLGGVVIFSAKLANSTTTVSMGAAFVSGGQAIDNFVLPDGRWTVTAAYQGDANDVASTSPGLAITVLPAPPTGLVANRGGSEATLVWTAPTTGVGAPITGYNIYKGTTTGGESAAPVNSTPITATNYTVRNLTVGTTYFFTVKSLNSTDTSIASAEISTASKQAQTGTVVSVNPPPAPTIYVANRGVSTIIAAPTGGGAQTTVGGGFDRPFDVAVDAAGNVFVADAFNHRIVKVHADGSADTTVGTGLQTPVAVAVASNGDVFIVDQAADQVVKVPGDGSAQTVMASGLNNPQGVAVDSVGDVFVAETTANRVLEYPVGGASRLTVGSGLLSPIGLAVDMNGDVFITDPGHNRVVRVPADGGAQSYLGSGLSNPLGVAVDVLGDVFISDLLGRVVKIDPNGAQTVAVSGLTTPLGLAVSATATVQAPNAVSLTANVETAPGGGPATGTVTFYDGSVPIGTGTLNGTFRDHTSFTMPGALSIGVHHISAMYNGDTGNLASAMSAPTIVNYFDVPSPPTAPSVTPSNGAATVAWTAPATTGGTPVTGYNVYVGTTSGGESATPANASPITSLNYTVTGLTNGNTYFLTVKAVNIMGSSGASTEVSTSAKAVTGTTLSVAPPPTPNIYVGDRFHQRVAVVPGDGTAQTTVGTGWQTPTGVAVDAAGDVFVADQSNTYITEIPAGGGAPISIGTGLNNPVGVAVDSAGNVYVADWGNTRIVKIPAGGGAQVNVVSGLTDETRGLAVNAAGDLFVADGRNNRVIEFPAGGGPMTTLNTGSLTLTLPLAVATDPAGNVYIADTNANRIVEVHADHSAATVVSTGAFSISSPLSVAADAAGDVVIGDTNNLRVVVVPASGAAAYSVGSGLGTVWGVAVQVPVAKVAVGPVALTATVLTSAFGANATGTVTFYDGASALGTAAVSGTKATLTPSLPTGTHHLTAIYGGNGDHLASTSDPITVTAAAALPGAPTALHATSGDGSVALSWNAPSTDGGSAILGYNVYRGTAAGGESATAVNASPVTTPSYTATGLTNGTKYYFTVRAVNAIGAGAASTETSATPLSTSSVVVTDDGAAAATGDTVTFTATVSGAAPTPTGSVVWSLGGPGSPTCATSTLVAGIATCSVVGVTPGVYSAVATYGGDLDHSGAAGSDDASVIPGGATIAITSSSGVVTGDTTVVTATVSGPAGSPIPTGTVFWTVAAPDGSPSACTSTGGPTTSSSATTYTCSIASAHAGSYGLTATYQGDDNYQPKDGSGTAAVGTAAVTVTAPTTSTKYGVVPAMTPSYTGLKNGDTAGNITVAPTCTSTVLVSTGVGAYPDANTCSGASDTDYTFSYVAGTATVTTTVLTVIAPSLVVPYGTTPTVTASYTGFANGETVTDLTSPAVCTTAVTSTTAVGTYVGASTCSGAADPNYTFSYVAGTMRVSAAIVTVTAPTTTSYGTAPAPAPSYVGFVNGDTALVLTSPATCTSTVLATTGVGVYTEANVCDGAVAPNYTFLYLPSTAVVTAAAVTVTASDGSMTYGGSPPVITASYAGFGNGQGASVLTTPVTCAPNVLVTTAAGSYPATSACSGGVAANYTFTYVPGAVTVAKAVLTVTASAGSMTYAGAVPVITAGYSGFVNAEGASVLSSAPSCVAGVTETTPVGVYANSSSCSGAAAANYAFAYVNGTVTVTAAPVTVTITGSQTYGSAATFTAATNVVGVTASAPTCTSVAGGSSIDAALGAGSYPLDGSTCAATLSDSNYAPSFTGTLTVAKKAVAVSASDGSMTYGGALAVITASYAGFVNGQGASVLTTPVACVSNVSVTTAAGSYAATSTCSGGVGANYTFTYPGRGTVTVSKAVLTVTASAGSMTYGGAIAVITASYAGFQNGQGAAVLSTAPGCTANVTTTTPAGTYASTSSCAGAAAANYSFAYVNGTVTINPKTVTVTAVAVTTPYGVVPAVAPSYAGFVNGQTVSVLTNPAVCKPNTTVTTAVGVHTNTSTCAGATAANYTFTYANGTVTVVKASVVVTTTAITQFASIRAGKMTYTSTVRNASSGAPVVGITVTVKVTTALLGRIVSCTGATNALGVATCTIPIGNLLVIHNPQPYTAGTPVTASYNAGSGNGVIHFA